MFRIIINSWRILLSRKHRRWFFAYCRAIKDATEPGRRDHAVAQLNEIISSGLGGERGRYFALELLGQVHVWNKQYDIAGDCLEEALALSVKFNLRHCDLYEYLGWVYYATGRYNDALKYFRLACEHGKKGIWNRLYTKHFSDAAAGRDALAEDEDMLGFMTAYYSQNRDKFERPGR